MLIDLYQVGTQCTNEKALEFYTLCTSSNIEVGSVSRLTLSRQVRSAVKLNGVVLGWANHRANRLIDLAALTFRFCKASAIAQGVEGILAAPLLKSLRRIYYRNEKRAQAKKHPHAKFK